MYFANFWYLLTFKNKLIYSNCIENLDSVILSEHILKPILDGLLAKERVH